MAAGDVVSLQNPYSFNIQEDTNIQGRFASRSVQSNSVSGHPVSYDEVYLAYSVSSPTSGYTDSTSTNYSTINLTRGVAGEITEFFYNFGLNIPLGATINSVTCKYKCYIKTTDSSYISTRQIQLFSGRNTAKGSPMDVSTDTNEHTMSNVGTWTAAELNNAKIRIYAVRASTNTTSSYYFRFYGATLSVSYTYDHATVLVNARSEDNNVTISPTQASPEVIVDTSQSQVQLLPSCDIDFILSCSSMNGYILTDNGTDVTNQVSVSHTANTGTAIIPVRLANDSSSNYNFATTTSTYFIQNMNHDSSYSGTPARISIAQSNSSATYMGWIIMDLTPLDEIPQSATINSVTWSIRYAVSSTSYITAVSMQLYTGNSLSSGSCTAKGYNQTGRSTSASTSGGSRYRNLAGGTWTLDELKTLKIHVSATKSTANKSSYIYLYGADVTVSYTIPTTFTTGIRGGDHTIILKSSGS